MTCQPANAIHLPTPIACERPYARQLSLMASTRVVLIVTVHGAGLACFSAENKCGVSGRLRRGPYRSPGKCACPLVCCPLVCPLPWRSRGTAQSGTLCSSCSLPPIVLQFLCRFVTSPALFSLTSRDHHDNITTRSESGILPSATATSLPAAAPVFRRPGSLRQSGDHPVSHRISDSSPDARCRRAVSRR